MFFMSRLFGQCIARVLNIAILQIYRNIACFKISAKFSSFEENLVYR